ncbi:MAG: hypothetical protein ACI8PZ_001959 [Myxococcota bacterium]
MCRVVFLQLCAVLLCTAALAGDPVVEHHLLTVASALRADTPASLDRATRARRLAHLDALEAYARAGAFPQPESVGPHARHTQPPRGFVSPDGPRMPMFVDDHGTHCAVGHLVAHDDPSLVARVVAEANTVWVADMRVDGLAEWARWSGFTLDEVAWIQPAYHAQFCEGRVRRPGPDPNTEQLPECDALAFTVDQAGFGSCLDCDHATQVDLAVRRTGAAVPETLVIRLIDDERYTGYGYTGQYFTDGVATGRIATFTVDPPRQDVGVVDGLQFAEGGADVVWGGLVAEVTAVGACGRFVATTWVAYPDGWADLPLECNDTAVPADGESKGCACAVTPAWPGVWSGFTLREIFGRR